MIQDSTTLLLDVAWCPYSRRDVAITAVLDIVQASRSMRQKVPSVIQRLLPLFDSQICRCEDD